MLALKMPLPQLVGSPILRERFVREAETWVGLGVHPHIVQCWYVLNISGLPCLFLDFLTGGSLKQWLAQGRLAPGQWNAILEVTMQVAQGLEHSHRRGVIHRDVKPENLLIRGRDRICVTDFGIVKTALPEPVATGGSEHGPAPEKAGVTGTGAYLGTPQYGAPEQWGAAERVGPAADIYALGITLYEMCCGRRPFDREGTTVPVENLIDAHLYKPPPDPREFRADIPGDLAAIILGCLAKDPVERPPSMEALGGILNIVYQKLTGAPYQGVPQLPEHENPDILNNKAVSLLSLGKKDQARTAWRRGLRLESGHPECLYNLVQYERRHGRINVKESLRRLRQAKAQYPLALFCLEQGLRKEAVGLLESITSEDSTKRGLVDRALGDALMYTRQYFAAERVYQKALELMPNDAGAMQRKLAAAQGLRELDGQIFFPAPVARFSDAAGDPSIRLLVDHHSASVLGVTAHEIISFGIEEERILGKVERTPDAGEVGRCWTFGERLLLEEPRAFELRQLPDLGLVGRNVGKILDVAANLTRMVAILDSGPHLFNMDTCAWDRIAMARPEPGQGPLLASFDRSGKQLCLLLPTGQLAQVDGGMNPQPIAWPSKVENSNDATCIALSRHGILYVGHNSGWIQAINIGAKTVVQLVCLQEPVRTMELAGDDNRLVIRLSSGHVVLDDEGRILLRNQVPLIVSPCGRHLLTFTDSFLSLYIADPFHLARRWEQKLQDPVGLSLGIDGRMAVSRDRRGQFQIWEVDEDHRVYERSSLLSPGQTYDELVHSHQNFQSAFQGAQEAWKNGKYSESYQFLRKARSVPGYEQFPSALDLTWDLIEKLGPNHLEAVWERLSLQGSPSTPVSISDDGEKALVGTGRELTMMIDSSLETRRLWTHGAEAEILAAQIRVRTSEESLVLFVDELGQGSFLSLNDGTPTRSFNLGMGPLIDVSFRENSILFASEQGVVGSFSLKTFAVTESTPPLATVPTRVFPGASGQAIVVAENLCGVVRLARKSSTAIEPFSTKGFQPSSKVTFVGYHREHKILSLGCQDGTVFLIDTSKGRLLYQIDSSGGPVSGFVLAPKLRLGIVATQGGHLVLRDLLSGKTLDRFVAHQGGVTAIAMDSNGRCFITSGADGQVRFWETSWSAAPPNADGRQVLAWLPGVSALESLGKLFGKG